MKIQLVFYNEETFTDDIYHRALEVVDPESKTRIQRFYHRRDASCCLIGRILPRMLLHEKGVALSDMKFAATPSGKPYITSPTLDPPLAYNVSHDNGFVAIVSAPGKSGSPAYQVGIDIMKVRLPGRESFAAFVGIMNDQLTSLEKIILLSSHISPDEALSRFYWIWTMKEAYTKALGLGLGFDFKRIQYDVPNDCVTVDGISPLGWSFVKFTSRKDGELYQGVAAEYAGGDNECTIALRERDKELLRYEAVALVEDALQKLVK